MEKQNQPPLIVPQPIDITLIHGEMYEQMSDKLVSMAIQTISRGENSADLFGLIMDIDDKVWREHIKLGSKIPPPDESRAGNPNRRLFSGIADRSDIQRLVDDVLPTFAEYFRVPPPTGYIHVLVVGVGMASPYTLHWGAELELEWD